MIAMRAITTTNSTSVNPWVLRRIALVALKKGTAEVENGLFNFPAVDILIEALPSGNPIRAIGDDVVIAVHSR